MNFMGWVVAPITNGVRLHPEAPRLIENLTFHMIWMRFPDWGSARIPNGVRLPPEAPSIRSKLEIPFDFHRISFDFHPLNSNCVRGFS